MKSITVLTMTLLVGSGLALAGHGPHWGYEGTEGPEHWGELAPDFTLCQQGKNQSPVDLSSAVDTQLSPIEFHYHADEADEVNNGHTIQINERPGNWITLDGQDYELKQFHFHTPSENHIDGQEFPMEMHLVHADRDGHLAVIGVMFKEGAEDATLKAAWDAMPTQPDSTVHLSTKLSPESLLPANRDYYRFTGSLTTPPCTEGVIWLVMREPITASAGQIQQFAKVMGHPNNRPVQPLNARVIQK